VKKNDKDTTFRIGLEPLRDLGNAYFFDSFYTVKKVEMNYTKSRVLMGRYKRTGQPFFLETEEAFRMIVLGSTRSGKTFLLRAMGDRLHEAGNVVLYLPDVKDEFRHSKKPLQGKFHRLLDPREKPKGMPVIALRPTFFWKLDHGEVPEGNRWFCVHPLDLSENDFKSLLNVAAMTAPQQTMMNIVFNKVHELYAKNRASFQMEDYLHIIDSLDDFNETQKHFVKVRLQPLINSKFYIPEYEYDLIDALKNGFMPAINMEGFDQFGRGDLSYPEVFVSILLRNVIRARVENKIGRLYIFTDEASRFIPAQGTPSVKFEFMESVDLTTRYHVNHVFATQQLNKVPPEILSQCRYVFLPYNADVSDIATVLMQFGMAKTQTARNDASRIKKRMGRFEWLVFDKNKMKYDVIIAAAPLSMHAETNN